jgi:hypothetical protein
MRFEAPLESCSSCKGLVPRARAAENACPHCGKDLGGHQESAAGLAGKVAGAAAVAIAGAGFAVTLMACYGPPPREYEKVEAPSGPSTASTSDGGAPSLPKAK